MSERPDKIDFSLTGGPLDILVDIMADTNYNSDYILSVGVVLFAEIMKLRRSKEVLVVTQEVLAQSSTLWPAMVLVDRSLDTDDDDFDWQQ